jgi:hypothetical protein
MTKEDINKSVLTGIVGGITAAVTILVLLWAYIFLTDWYKDYKQQKEAERIASIPPDKRSGDFCPKCKSTDVGNFFYGYYKQGENDSIDNAVRSNRLIPGGCILDGSNPKYRCNSCYYEWGNYR